MTTECCGVEIASDHRFCPKCGHEARVAAEGLIASPQPELHANCHDLVCNGDRSKPRGTKGVSCSCYQRDKRMAEEFAALKAAEVSSPARPQGLTFNDLQATNKQRCETAFHSVDAWKPWDWSNAIAGEVGEACAEGLTLLAAIAARSGAVCNLTKKMARVWPANEFKQNWNTPEDQRISDLEAKLANELADVVIYADLLATRIGRSLGDCVRAKFNAKSNEIGSSVKLAEGAVSAAPPAQEQKEKS